jgi:hypothetical protein
MNSVTETLRNIEFILRKYCDKFAGGLNIQGMKPRVDRDQIMRRRDCLTREEHDKILELHASGMRQCTISERMQRSPACVSRVCKGNHKSYSAKMQRK